jgi:glycosyltransferase involved in cell wall biosynthesis
MTPLDIVFVSSHPRPRHYRADGSFIYRCENLGLGLSALGHRVSLRHLNDLLVGPARFDIAVFMRPADSLRFRWAIARLRRGGCRLMADFDDLIFHADLAAHRPSVLSGQARLESTQAKFRLHERALPAFDGVVLSTRELAESFSGFYPSRPHSVIPNAVFRPWRALPRVDTWPRRITYFSGTRTHDRDFALVEPALVRLLEERDDVHLQLVGPLKTRLDHARIERIGRVDFGRYADLVRASHLNLAPLEDTPFNRCKSALKAIEAGCFGVPTVASPIGDYLRVAPAGVLFAADETQWYEQLCRGVDESSHAGLAAGLAQRLHPLSDVDAFARDFLQFAS